MIILIAVCSVIGILIVRFSPFPKAVGLTAAFALCQVIYLMSGTSFAPLISAAALPVLMDTETIIYPISAVTMTALTCLAQYILERAGVCEKENFVPLAKPDKFRWISAIVRVGAAAVLAFPLIHFGVQFCIAPPLLVAFTEFSDPQSKARSKPVKIVLIITGCALTGALLRYLLCCNAGTAADPCGDSVCCCGAYHNEVRRAVHSAGGRTWSASDDYTAGNSADISC